MFNLVKNCWISVLMQTGSKLVSLRELFKNLSQIFAIEGASIEKISLLRLLICITQAALKGPKTEQDWKTCKKDIVPKVLKYLDKWESKFDLYEKNAFLQMPWLPELKNKTLDNLQILCPSGANHTLFDHKSVVLSEEEIALALLVTQEFGVGGLVQFPEFKWLGKKIPAMKSATATSINNILLTVILGDDLLDTIHHNLIPIEELNRAKIEFGSPVWEYDPFGKNDPEYKAIQSSYLGNIVPLTRGIVLYPGQTQITIVDGIVPLEYPAYQEPMATRKTVKIAKTSKKKKKSEKEKDKGKDKPYLPCSIYKAGWRELESILQLPGKDGISHSGAWAFKHFADQMDSHPKITVMVAGFASFQAKKEAVLEWVLSLPKGFLAKLFKYKKFVEMTEECSKTLYMALWVCINEERKNSKPGSKDNVLAAMKASASSEYWPRMEIFAMKALEIITEDIDWESEILKEARLIYDRACPGISINSRVKGLQLLYRGGNNGSDKKNHNMA